MTIIQHPQRVGERVSFDFNNIKIKQTGDISADVSCSSPSSPPSGKSITPTPKLRPRSKHILTRARDTRHTRHPRRVPLRTTNRVDLRRDLAHRFLLDRWQNAETCWRFWRAAVHPVPKTGAIATGHCERGFVDWRYGGESRGEWRRTAGGE
jgi:hypothetical protein